LKYHGSINHNPSHLIDLMPTILEAANATYPIEFNGQNTAPLAGKSILPLLRGKSPEQRTFYFEHEGNRAVNDGRWKLTALNGQDWELYDIENDRTELDNLAAKHPDIVAKLDRAWNIWAEENFVTPLPKNLRAPYLKPVR
jgi:arylsulfatase